MNSGSSKLVEEVKEWDNGAIGNLPSDLWLIIFAKTGMSHLQACPLVCKEWREWYLELTEKNLRINIRKKTQNPLKSKRREDLPGLELFIQKRAEKLMSIELDGHLISPVFFKVIEAAAQCKQLEHLRLTGNMPEPEVLADLSSLPPSLKSLALNKSVKLVGNVPLLPNLQSLALSSLSWWPEQQLQSSTLESLQEIVLIDAFNCQHLIPAILSLPNLKVLRLTIMCLASSTVDYLASLSCKLPALEFLQVGGVEEFSDTSMAKLKTVFESTSIRTFLIILAEAVKYCLGATKGPFKEPQGFLAFQLELSEKGEVETKAWYQKSGKEETAAVGVQE